MKAAVLYQPREIIIKDVPEPNPQAGEVMIRVKSVGICGTDFHYWRTGSVGNFTIREPFILGHEVSGQVVQVGQAVSSLSVGDRVVVDIQVPCGRCRFCRMGRYNLCPVKRCMGDPPTNGAFAEYVTWPADFTYAMPHGMTFDEGALIEPLSIGLYVVSRARICLGDSVVIMGAGTVGLMALYAALAAGADEVYVVDIDDWRLDKAKEFGATATINAKDDVASRIHDLTNGSYVDTTIEASGSTTATIQAVRVTRRGGKIALVGVYDTGKFTYPLLDVIMKELTVMGNIDGANAFPKSLNLMASEKIDAEKLITHHLPLEDIERGFKILDEKKEHALKIQLHP
jgi:L-iditol 2-dehydrogenase